MAVKRRQLLGDRLFFDPAWNMLLDLFISESTGRRLSVTALCIGSHSSAATALRYATLLMDAGLIARVADETDGRRSHVHLTAEGWRVMKTLLSC
jgi:DNA-binding MarR family transcriptional regulator